MHSLRRDDKEIDKLKVKHSTHTVKINHHVQKAISLRKLCISKELE